MKRTLIGGFLLLAGTLWSGISYFSYRYLDQGPFGLAFLMAALFSGAGMGILVYEFFKKEQ